MTEEKQKCECGTELSEDGFCFFCDGPDAHSCQFHSDVDGYCQYCGAVLFGSHAYRDLYGGE